MQQKGKKIKLQISPISLLFSKLLNITHPFLPIETQKEICLFGFWWTRSFVNNILNAHNLISKR